MINFSFILGKRMPFLHLGTHFHEVAYSKEVGLQPSFPLFPKGHCLHLFMSLVYILFNFVQITDAGYLPSTVKHSRSVFSCKEEEGQKKKHCLNAEKTRVLNFLFLGVFKSLTADPWERWVQAVAYSNSFHRMRNLASFPLLSYELDRILCGMQFSLMSST